MASDEVIALMSMAQEQFSQEDYEAAYETSLKIDALNDPEFNKMATNLRNEIAQAGWSPPDVAFVPDPAETWPGEGPVSVATQKAAGVPPEETVTIANQKSGVPLPVNPSGGEQPSVGTSSSASEKMPDKSGSSAQEMESSSPSPAQMTESPSSQDQASKQAQSSTAPSASGSTQETGCSQPDQSNSSAEPQTQEPLETEAILPLNGRELIQAAREAYDAKDWEKAHNLLIAALDIDPSLSDEVDVALRAVQAASEQDPSTGGFLVK